MPIRLTLFALLLLLSGLLLAAGGAHGAPAEPSADEFAFEEAFESEPEEAEGEEEGECEIAEEEVEEGEREQDEVEEICAEADDSGRKKTAGPGSLAPEECLLRSIHGHAAVNAEGDTLKLTIGYTTYEPVSATLEVRGGSERIAASHRHLGRSGVLRIVKSLKKDQAPKRVTVQIGIPNSPRYCGKYRTEQIPTQRAAH